MVRTTSAEASPAAPLAHLAHDPKEAAAFLLSRRGDRRRRERRAAPRPDPLGAVQVARPVVDRDAKPEHTAPPSNGARGAPFDRCQRRGAEQAPRRARW
jgi:hypothetical protein